MPSYNEIDGIPSHSNKHLLDDILRQEWGFQGLVVSDYFGITELKTVHHIVAENEPAARYAIDAGVDMELPFAAAYPTLAVQIKEGKVSEDAVERAVTRILRAKFMAGLFDDPFVNPDYAEKITNNPEHRKLALKAAHEAIILLKNQDGLLPLSKEKYKRIAVIGPNAAEVHLGGYSDKPGRGISVLQGIKNKAGAWCGSCLRAGMQDYGVQSGLGRRYGGAGRSQVERRTNCGSGESGGQRGRDYSGAGRERTDFARGVGRES